MLRVTIVAAGWHAGEAHKLRRSMAAWKGLGDMQVHRVKIIDGMLRIGYDEAFAIQFWEKTVSFSGYDFPRATPPCLRC